MHVRKCIHLCTFTVGPPQHCQLAARLAVPQRQLEVCTIVEVCGRDGETRTPDLLLPKQARYQTALHPGEQILQAEPVVDALFGHGRPRGLQPQ